nr:sigma-70 family RNA polymerase sigma factor [Actinomadura rudentiformis]
MPRWSSFDVAADRALVQRLNEGDESALGALYDAYAERLYDYCVTMTGEHKTAADIVHDTFIDAFRRAPRLRDQLRLRPWLYAAARRRCLQRGRVRGLTWEKDGEFAETSPLELRELLETALARLSFSDQETLLLAMRHGLRSIELGAALGLSARRAAARLARAQVRLKTAVEAEFLVLERRCAEGRQPGRAGRAADAEREPTSNAEAIGSSSDRASDEDEGSASRGVAVVLAAAARPQTRRPLANPLRRTTRPHPAIQADNAPLRDGAPDRGMPERGTSERGLPERGLPERGVPERGVPERGVLERSAPEQAVPERGTSERGMSERGVPERGAPEHAVPERGVPERGVSERGARERGVSEGDVPAAPAASAALAAPAASMASEVPAASTEPGVTERQGEHKDGEAARQTPAQLEWNGSLADRLLSSTGASAGLDEAALERHAAGCSTCDERRQHAPVALLVMAPAPVLPVALRHRVIHTGSDPELAGYRTDIVARGGTLTPDGLPSQPDVPSPVTRRWLFAGGGMAGALATALLVALVMGPGTSIVDWSPFDMRPLPGVSEHRPPSGGVGQGHQPGQGQGPANGHGGGSSDSPQLGGERRSVPSPSPQTPESPRSPKPPSPPVEPKIPGLLTAAPGKVELYGTKTARVVLTAHRGPVTWSSATSTGQVTATPSQGSISKGDSAEVIVTLSTGLVNLPGQSTLTFTDTEGRRQQVTVVWGISLL